jgi:hypothetical protein
MRGPYVSLCLAAVICIAACGGPNPSAEDIQAGTLSSGGISRGGYIGSVALAATSPVEMATLLTMVGADPDPNCVSTNGWVLRCWTGWGDFKDRAGVIYLATVAGGNPCDRLTGVKAKLIGSTLKVTPLISDNPSCGGARIGHTDQLFWVDRSHLGDGLLDVAARRASPDGVEYSIPVFARLDLRRPHGAIASPPQSDAASAFQWGLDQVNGRYGPGVVPARLGLVWEDPQQPCSGGASVAEMKLGYQMDFVGNVGSPWYRVAGGNGIGLSYCGSTPKPSGAI